MMETFDSPVQYNLIYVYSIPDEAHRGCLKVGETTLKSDSMPSDLVPKCKTLNQAAIHRIDQCTQTAGIKYELEYTELALREKAGYTFSFHDRDVHKVLMNSGVRKVKPNHCRSQEWFETSLATVKEAIAAVKKGNTSISPNLVVKENDYEPIEFREEQKEAIEKTIDVFKKKKEMLWYAKMRFGKTLTALEVIRRKQYRKVIIVTHRPVVDDGWSEDFKKIFFPGNSKDDYQYERKTKDSSYTFDEKIDLENDDKIKKLDKDKKHFIYFASMQDLRGSKVVGGKYDKNNEVFNLDWDLIVIDEAHEGTQTELGDEVIKKLRKKNTRVLALSGTPFNLLDQYEEDAVYTWDYVMEQKKKEEWDALHEGDHNPYASLPQMHIYTYDLGDTLRKYVTDEYGTKAFNFREFFRVWRENADGNRNIPDGAKEGTFVHEKDVIAFLDRLADDKEKSGYPYSTEKYRNMFHHTLWMVPGVKEAKALSELLHKHPIFKGFGIANVAGEGDNYEEIHARNALELVRKTIEENQYSITLSCGKLTTGVTVPEWTAVFMLSGSYSTAAAQYMQTIFRVQSAGQINGKEKTDCYVFDFAPDRTLKVLAETAHLSRKPGKNEEKQRKCMEELLRFCPVISIVGSKTKKHSVESMMEQIKRIYTERAVNSGFDDDSIYSEALYQLGETEAKEFSDLQKIIGTTESAKKKIEVVVNKQGLTDTELKTLSDTLPKKPKKQLTEEEKEALQKIQEAKDNRKKAISILRAISIRMPLLIYGAHVPIEEDIDLDRFIELIDDASWKEFMPKDVTKAKFKHFTKYYDRDVFIAAGRRIRELTHAAEKETITRRVMRIADIFSHFKNPDKETVLTPWRVVNMHMAETIGGWCFFNETYQDDTEDKKYRLTEPRKVEKESLTKELFRKDAHILEINSKTGLYPLYVAYSFYRERMKGKREEDYSPEEREALWKDVIEKNIYVICKTPMAKSITQRTLCGYQEIPCNAHYFDHLVGMLREKPNQFKKKVTQGKYWKKDVKEMKFDAVVGNPPYQEETKGNSNAQKSIYHYFIDISERLAEKGTLIHPARFLFNAGNTPKDWNTKKLNDSHFKVVKYWPRSADVFSTVDIKGGIAITYWDKRDNYKPIGLYIPYPELKSIHHKVENWKEKSLSSVVTHRGAYRYSDLAYKEQPDEMKKMTDRRITTGSFERSPKLFLENKPDDRYEYMELLGTYKNRRCYRWIRKDYVEFIDNLEKFKVIVPKANGSGAIGEVLSTPLIGTPLIGTPLIGYTETYISIGATESREEAEATMKYIKTKFARTLLGILKVTQDNTKEVWKYVPLQDFTEKSDIDWTKSVAEIDGQLYKKYGLSQAEIDFIESHVQAMT